jgi:hypothetical protein
MTSILALILVFGGGILLTGCSDNPTDPLAPFEPEIINNPDNFQFQVTDVTDVTTIVTYTWQNTGTSANVNQSCAVTAGTVTLVILDADSNQVYSRDLSENGTFQTTAGTTGNWTIHVTLSNVSGTLNFRAEKG